MANEDAFACATHAMVVEVLLEALQSGDDRRIFFWLRFFDAEGIVREGVESDFAGLLGIETQRDCGRLGRLQRRWRYRGHVEGDKPSR